MFLDFLDMNSMISDMSWMVDASIACRSLPLRPPARSDYPPRHRAPSVILQEQTCDPRVGFAAYPGGVTTLPLAEVESRLSAVLDEVRATHERVVITRRAPRRR